MCVSHTQCVRLERSGLIVSGTAGTGMLYFIHYLRLLLRDRVYVATPTGVAALRATLSTPSYVYQPMASTRAWKERIYNMQVLQSLAGMHYLVIDKIPMVGRKVFGEVDKLCHQVFPHHADQLFGGCSCRLFGDFGHCHQWWISLGMQQCHELFYLISAVQHTNFWPCCCPWLRDVPLALCHSESSLAVALTMCIRNHLSICCLLQEWRSTFIRFVLFCLFIFFSVKAKIAAYTSLQIKTNCYLKHS